jgi:hypothetical protein
LSYIVFYQGRNRHAPLLVAHGRQSFRRAGKQLNALRFATPHRAAAGRGADYRGRDLFFVGITAGHDPN